MTLKFIKTDSTHWRGNGFGTAAASWAALVDGVQVATFDGNHSKGVYSDGTPMFESSATAWKRTLTAKFAADAPLTAAQKKVLTWVGDGLISWHVFGKCYSPSGNASYASPATYRALSDKGLIRREGKTVVAITEAGKAVLGS